MNTQTYIARITRPKTLAGRLRTACTTTLLPLLLLVALPAVVEAQFTYMIDNGTITIMGYTGQGGAVAIPGTINGLPVTIIGTNAFGWCSSLISVTIPNSVTNVQMAAFYYCTNLTGVTIGSGVTNIGDLAFYSCSSLTNVTIPDGVTSIGHQAFQYCGSLTSVSIGSGVTSIGYEPFGNCTRLTSITVNTLNSAYSSLDGGLFNKTQTTLVQYAPGLAAASYTIPNGVTGIGDYAFASCTSLLSVTIPDSVTTLGNDAFYGCTSLTSITIPDSVFSLGDSAFAYCSSLTDLTIPNRVVHLRVSVFACCSSLTTMTIGNSVNSIEYGAFGNCPNLTALHFGGNAPSLGGSEVFQGDNRATVYYLPGTTGWGATFGGRPTALWQQSPGASTLSASPITPTGATLNGTVNPNGYPTSAWFQWGGTTNYGSLTSVTNLGCGITALPLSVPLAGLTLHATYHFRIAATNDYGLAYGSDQSFTTSLSPSVTTLPATDVSTNNATLNGKVNPNGWPTTAWFQWGATTNYGNLTPVTDLGSGTIVLPLSAPVTGLAPTASYHFRIAATNDYGVVYGSDQSFTTAPPPFTDADWVSLGAGVNGEVMALAVNGANLYAGGWFTTAGGVTVNRIAEWDGSAWSALGSGMDRGPVAADVFALALSGTDLYAGGQFTTAGGVPANNIAKWGGSAWSALGSGINGDYDVEALVVSGNNAYAGGFFPLAGGLPANNIAKWNGSAWSALGSGMNGAGYVWALAVGGTNLYAGGPFTTAGGVTANYIAKWDGRGWSTLGSGMDNSVVALAVIGNNLYAGGRFTTAGGVPANHVAKWDGNAWSALGSGVDSDVEALAVDGVNLYAGGWFTIAGEVPADHIAKWDGNAWSALGSGTDGIVGALAADGAGHLFVAGSFGRAGTTLSSYIAQANVGTGPISPPPPEVHTLSATGVSTNSATLNATVNPNGYPTTAWFQWGTTTNYGNLTSMTNLGSGITALPLSVPLAGLTLNVTYHFRIAATNDYGLVYGSDQSFTTSGRPQISTLAATGVSPNSATLNGTVNPNGWPTTAWFQWGVTYSNLTSATALGSGTTALPLAAPLAGLTPGVTYHFRVAATNHNGVVYGSDQSFTTLAPPQVSTLPATGVSSNTATLNGTVNPIGWPTTAWFQWGTTTSYGNLTSVADLGSGTTALPLSAPLAGLTLGVTYHFRIAATNDYGLVYGSDQSFTTQAQWGDAGWTLNGGATMTGNTITLTVGAGNTSRSAFLNNKQDITTFHIVFYYQDATGAGSADGVTFCIQNDPRGATALGGGNGGSSLGYDNINPSVALAMNIYDPNTRGIAFDLNGARITPYQSLLPNVDIGGNTNVIQVNVDYNGTVMTMTFQDTVTGGIAGTNWTVNIPSVVGDSTAYVGFTGADGGVASIQTISWGNSSPTLLISTLPATGVSTNSATLNSTVNPNGWPTTAWFQWGTTANYGNLTSVTDLGSGTNALPLSAPLAGLTPGVTYHYRIVATNDYGLAYGSDQSFATLGLPQVSTLPATGVSTISATLNGTVIPNGWPTTAWFQWGATTSYGNLTSVTALGSGTTALPLSAPLAGLTPGVTYHFRIAATNDYGLVYGSDQSFTTDSLPTEFNYTINNGTVTITGYTGPGGAVAIPDTIDGLPVTAIGGNYNAGYWAGAFYDTSVTSVTIPNSVTSIGQYAFYVCMSLSSVTIPNSVTNIAAWAFAFCTSLTSVTIPNSISSIADGMFDCCSSITNVTIPNSVTNIGDSAFNSCGLTSVTIPNSVISIGGYAFESCTRLTSVTIPDSVTSIGGWAFGVCSSLTAITVDTNNLAYSSVDGVLFNKSQNTLVEYPGGKRGSYTIPNRVTSISPYAFSCCSILTSVTIPNSVTGIPEGAFYQCTGLTSVTIPNSVTSIGIYAFADCTRLTSVTIPNSVTNVALCTFQSCTSLTNVTIGNSVTDIGDSAFYDCPSLTSVMIPNSVTNIEDYAFDGCRALTSVTIPNSVTGIGDGAFCYCSSLTNVAIGSGLTNIGSEAFYYCSSLTAVYFQGSAPSLGSSDVFYGDNNATVYYLWGTAGWRTAFGGLPTALWTPTPPTIQKSPQPQTAEAGSAVRLNVQASSPLPLFCVWYFNSTNLLICSTSCELELPNVQFSQSGAYTAVITNAGGAVSSSPAMLQVIPTVERTPVPGVKVTGQTGALLNVDYADSLSPAPTWTPLGSVSLTGTPQYCFDLTLPLPPQRFYRAWQTGTPGVRPSLDLHLVPAITLTGSIGGSVRLDYINQFGPIDAWVTLATVPLTNTSQLYFDISAPGQPPRLYRLVPSP